jgi:hypothetical protein
MGALCSLPSSNDTILLLSQATPGLKKCYHENIGLSVMKVVVGIALQIMCSYITFPLYALVTQVERTADELLERKMGTRP